MDDSWRALYDYMAFRELGVDARRGVWTRAGPVKFI